MFHDPDKKFEINGYMIRRKSDGKFSRGGVSPEFSKAGKIWNTLGAFKNHLNLAIVQANAYYSTRERQFVNPYTDCEIYIFTPEGLKLDESNLLQQYVELAQRTREENQRRWNSYR